jgi:hypothetical protein
MIHHDQALFKLNVNLDLEGRFLNVDRLGRNCLSLRSAAALIVMSLICISQIKFGTSAHRKDSSESDCIWTINDLGHITD